MPVSKNLITAASVLITAAYVLITAASVLMLRSCVDPFEPEIRESQEVIVINGVVTDREGWHRATVSMSAPYNEPFFNPVRGCVVVVLDEEGEIRTYSEKEPGVYEVWLEKSFLRVGKSFSMEVFTPSGDHYVSDFDTLLACPPVDSVYYEVRAEGTSDPGVTRYGLQFFCDVSGREEDARNFRWLLEETWEYTSPYTATYIWFGGAVLPLLKDTVSTCYRMDPVPTLFAASNRSLNSNRIRKFPLHYVSNATPRLLRSYNLLVKQHSLSNQAFAYWEQMAAQSGAEGGLYETQPSTAKGNFYGRENPGKEVLGCFYATQQQETRIMVEEEFDFFIPWYTCTLDTIQSVRELGSLYPYYLFSLNPMGAGPPYTYGSRSCFDCREKGGSNVKPDFW